MCAKASRFGYIPIKEKPSATIHMTTATADVQYANAR
jgi:hypothetical protein